MVHDVEVLLHDIITGSMLLSPDVANIATHASLSNSVCRLLNCLSLTTLPKPYMHIIKVANLTENHCHNDLLDLVLNTAVQVVPLTGREHEVLCSNMYVHRSDVIYTAENCFPDFKTTCQE